ncbi:MAG: hypothetical protein LBE62_12915 [Azonexus sp.]|jgi:hypothetical protein|nr:hypothetical protein [Azonexus sp.]
MAQNLIQRVEAMRRKNLAAASVCADCRFFLPSEKANQRAVLEGFGYCHAENDPMIRARFFRSARSCWQVPLRFEERRDA